VGTALAPRHRAAPFDINLPGPGGFEVARRLRAGPGASVRLVAHTAYSGAGARERAAEAGFDAYLLKPACFEELLRLLGASA
jgi:CheY-like chemotaxis protein